MNQVHDHLTELCALAIDAAGMASSHIRSEAGKPRETLHKQGGDSHASQVVTEVDFQCQRMILEALGDSMEKHGIGILTEESPDDASRHSHEHFWCIDPLDGTLPFIENVAGYSVSIALVSRSGIPLIGVIADPVTGAIYHAIRNAGAFRDGRPLSIHPHTRGTDRKLTLVTDRSFSRQASHKVLLERIHTIAAEHGLAGVEIINQGGAAMNACWVIENAPAIYFKFPKPADGGGSLWDYAASACLFGELGAVASDIHGHPLQLNRPQSTFMNQDGVLFASQPSLARAIYGLYRELRP